MTSATLRKPPSARALLLALSFSFLTTNCQADPPKTGKLISNPRQVTLADNGATVRIAQGKGFLLRLGGPPPLWQVRISGRKILKRARNISMVSGGQGYYVGYETGSASLSAEPVRSSCTPERECPAGEFKITVEVLKDK